MVFRFDLFSTAYMVLLRKAYEMSNLTIGLGETLGICPETATSRVPVMVELTYSFLYCRHKCRGKILIGMIKQ